ncbi:MAG: twin-arginine translocation signal domain-containing protein, partial [Pirellulales bacterium]|nr:twin-arginine translocation signal domain-containing protein [Pirellulales bacterium]
MSTNMHRRHFLGTSAAAAAAGTIFSSVSCTAASQESAQDNARITPAILKTYTNTDHRQRLENIRICHENIRGCMRKHLITDYLPGQSYYNLGEFPCATKPRGNPDELDEQELDRLQQHGIEVIQVHEEWNNWLRLPGGDKMTPLNPNG